MPLLAILEVAGTNLLLSGDNVLVIALMSKTVDKRKRFVTLAWALGVSLILGFGILVLLSFLFRFSILKAVFGAVVCFMAFHLVRTHASHLASHAPQGVGRTVLRIVTGNLLMSFENDVALIALAHGNPWTAWSGVLITAPLLFFGSHLVSWVLHRYPLLVDAGAVYLFHLGTGLVLAIPGLPHDARLWAWGATVVFTGYAAVRYIQRMRAAPPIQ